MGKKQTCPYCKEKVDLKKMFCNPYPLKEIKNPVAFLSETIFLNINIDGKNLMYFMGSF